MSPTMMTGRVAFCLVAAGVLAMMLGCVLSRPTGRALRRASRVTANATKFGRPRIDVIALWQIYGWSKVSYAPYRLGTIVEISADGKRLLVRRQDCQKDECPVVSVPLADPRLEVFGGEWEE